MSTPGADERAAESERDRPGVAVLPPLLYAGAFLLMLALHWPWPMRIFCTRSSLWTGLTLLVLGLILAVAGRRALVAAGTEVNPTRPTTALVTSGPYRFTRNPLYVALTLVWLGLAALVNTWWGVILFVPLLAIMHWGVILREERYLERKFADTYRLYRSRVRRYL